MMKPRAQAGDGFSLIELMAVVAIMLILMSVGMAGFHQIQSAGNLSNAAYQLSDQIEFARQTAIARNGVVELRLYEVKGENGEPAAYRALRSVIHSEAGNAIEPLGRVQRLPAGILVVPDERYSTILSDANPNLDDAMTEDLPGAPGASYKAIVFSPLGGTTLDPAGTPGGDKWDLTVRGENDKPTETMPARNFITIVIDPVNGHVKTFQP